MGSVPTPSRKSIIILIGALTLLCVGLLTHYPFARVTFAQDEPTDRPFPTAVTTTAAPVSTNAATLESTAAVSTVSSTAASGDQPTDRPFPTAAIATTATTAATAASTAAATEQPTPTLTSDNAMATITALQTENKDLQEKLASAQLDKGATLYAVVIVVIGLLLAFAVFFGLRRSGK